MSNLELSDVENNMNIVNSNTICNETDNTTKNAEKEETKRSDDQIITAVHKKKLNLNDDVEDSHFENKSINSPSDDSDSNTGNSESKTEKRKSRIKRLDSSDSDSSRISDENNSEEITVYNKSFTDNENCDSANNSINNLDNFNSNKPDDEEPDEENEITPIAYKRKPKKAEESETKKISAKESAELIRSIKSERQKRIRETVVCLPYHKPKSHSLQEFLSRRSKLKSVFPDKSGISPAMAIKMTEEEISIVTQRMKEREKEIKEFYKSESEESDAEEDKDYNPESDSDEEKETNPSLDSENPVNENVVSMEIGESSKKEICDAIEKENTTQVSSSADTFSNEANLTENTLDPTVNIEHVLEDEHNSEEVDSGIVQSNSMDGNVCSKENSDISNNENTKEDDENSENTNSAILESTTIEKMSVNINIDEPILDIEKEKGDNVKNASYEFNLDTVAADSEEILTENQNKSDPSANKESKKFDTDEIDQEIANFEDAIPEQPKSKIKELLKEKLANVQPRLSGGPMEVIDLESGVVKPSEISQLIDRFAKHATTKKHHRNHDVSISLTTVESSGSIHKETMIFNIGSDEDIVEEKPHAKHQKLKTELKNKMIQKRMELWEARQKKAKEEEEEILDDAVLDAEEEHDEEDQIKGKEGNIDEDHEEEVEEEEEDEEYIQVKDKKKEKSEFVDNEAEVSDKEDYEGDCEDEEMDDDGKETNEVETEEQVETDENTIEESKKRLKRIIVESDSESEPEDNLIIIKDSENPEQMNKTDKEDIEETTKEKHVTAVTATSSKTPQRKTTQSEFGFLTPITYNHSLNSASKAILRDSPVISPFNHLRHEPSPLKEENWQPTLQKKLFSEDFASQSTEEKVETIPELENETSKMETSLEEKEYENLQPADLEEDCIPTTQDLAGICSGDFTGLTALPSKKPVIEDNSVSEVKNPEDDLIISQLLDEEEMENFKKKFESPLYASNSSKLIIRNAEEVKASGGIIDSDDEDENIKIKKKNQKKLTFSDDENEDEMKANNESEDEEEECPVEEETINLHDDLSDNEDEQTKKNVYYDSEENEIELEEEEIPKAATDFFENEAELSESEWGSADEDEKDMDKYELDEEAEAEARNINEDKLKSDLERIHMRQLLDEDNREVKLLQELLLEDGELHGTGRQKQFRWRNIDNVDDTENQTRNNEDEDDIIFDYDEESEEQWRKQRHEREKFLSEEMKKSQDLVDDFLSGSQLLKIGQKVLKKTEVSTQKEEKIKEKSEMASLKITSRQRGSFLTRSNQVLERLAASTKITTTEGTTIKNSRHFLFQSVSLAGSSIMEEKKRKATENTGGTPAAIKKLRLNSSILNATSPAASSKKSSTKSKKVNSSKKLFTS